MFSHEKRYPRWNALRSGVFAAVLLSSSCSRGERGANAQNPEEQAPAQATVDGEALARELRALETEMKRLYKGEGAPQAYLDAMAAQKEISKLRSEQQDALKAPQKELNEFWQHEDVRTWKQKLSEAQTKVNAARRRIQEAIQARGSELHARRRQELAAVTVTDAPRARALGFNTFSYPRVDGSTSAAPLGLIVACKTLGVDYRWMQRKNYSGFWIGSEDRSDKEAFDHSTFSPLAMAGGSIDIGGYHGGRYRGHADFTLIEYRPAAVAPDAADAGDRRLATIVNRMLTTHAGTHGSYVNLINGQADLALVARRPSADELKLAEEKGVQLDVRPCALDAFVFIRNYKNPVTTLTVEQVRGIYDGTITKWGQVGGPDLEINAYQRNPNSGSQELMKALVMKGGETEKLNEARARRLVRNGMGGPYIALTHDQRGIAYSVYYYEHFMAASPNTELVGINGVVPSFQTISDRTYPYVTEVYVAAPSDLPETSGAARLRAWLLSREGQAVVRESGYVPLLKRPGSWSFW